MSAAAPRSLEDGHSVEDSTISALTPSHSPSQGQSPRRRPAPRGTSSYPRKRAVKACQVCRARRTKCDNLKPSCSFCLKTGAKCIQSPIDLSSFDPASLQILDRLNDLEHLLRSSQSSANTEPLPLAVEHHINHDDLTEPEKVSLVPPILEYLLDIDGNGKTPSLLITLRHHALANDKIATTAVPSMVELEARDAKTLMDNFFNYVHVKNPILDEAPFRKMVLRLCLRGFDSSADSCLALLVCALGSIATPFDQSECLPDSPAYCTAQAYFQAAQRRLGNLMVMAGLVEAQCFFLAGVYLITIFQPTSAWRCFTQALACCQEFDFVANHITSGEIHNFSVAEQAIYWSSWKSNHELRANLEPHDFMLPAQQHEYYPPFLPTPPSIAETIDQESNSGGNPSFEREQRGWYFYLAEISLRRLSSGITDGYLQMQGRPTAALLKEVADLLGEREMQVQQWVDTLPPMASITSDAQYDDVCKYVLRGHLLHCYESLYWPFLDYILAQLGKGCDHSDCTALETRIKGLAEEALRKHVERISVNEPGFKHRHHGTWSMIRSCTRSALMLMRIAVVTQNLETPHPLNLVLPHGWQTAVLKVIDLNRYWEREAPDAQERLPLLVQMFSDLTD